MTLAEQTFFQRLRTWEALHRQAGAGRSYPYAWRLPELARPLGPHCLHRAENALALDLYTLGRFREALAALSPANVSPGARALRRRACLLLGEPATAAETPEESACLAYLADRPESWRAGLHPAAQEADRLWGIVLESWVAARRGQASSPAKGHRVLAGLRARDPARAAQAEAVLAEALFHQGPRWAVVWLDHALAQAELFSQHHLKVRLLGLKAQSLEAAGALGEGNRFRKLARDLAERQEAELYRRLFIDCA